ncbi:MAG: hypothetical protein NVSMB2_18960 [Chloroflexota bacterium]
MTTSEPSEPGRTAPIEIPAPTSHDTSVAPPPRLVTPDAPEASTEWVAPLHDPTLRTDTVPHDVDRPRLAAPIAATAVASTPDVMYVPLAVSIGDGFKFGCGFFLAAVVALLVAFVVFAALFALTSVSGVSLPLGR